MNRKTDIMTEDKKGTEVKTALLKIYRKPRLEKLGDLRTITLGVSGAPVDFSGGQLNQKTP